MYNSLLTTSDPIKFNPDNFFAEPEEIKSNKKRCYETSSSISSNVNEPDYETSFKRQKTNLPIINVEMFRNESDFL